MLLRVGSETSLVRLGACESVRCRHTSLKASVGEDTAKVIPNSHILA